MSYRVVLYLNTDHDLEHYARIYAGLELLTRRGLIDLRVAPAQELSPLQWLDVTPPGRTAPVRVALDLNDHGDEFYPDGLDRCDVYFKRSFYRPDLERLAPALRSKVIPFGLNYACSVASSRRRILWHWLGAEARRLWRSPRRVWAGARWRASMLKLFLQQPDYRLFEQPPDAAAEPMVLYQTRVWEPEKSSEDLEQINEQRVGLIRALRKALGPRFRGGVTPTAFARRLCPDVLLTESYRRADYIRMAKGCLIGVYTRGLHHSLAFKLPEYLAAALCVVSDPLRNELPRPLTAGRHYYEFRGPDECAAQCERLLSRPDEVRAMRQANYDYYRQWVAPDEHLLHCLERVARWDAEGGRGE